MNSALQALLSSKHLTDKVESLSKYKNISKLHLEFNDIIFQMKKTNTTLRPSNFKRELGKINTDFKGSRQQDSNAMILTMLDELIDPKNNSKKNKKLDELKNVFYGKYKQYVQCNSCKKYSITEPEFLDILLPITKDTDNIKDSFQELCSWEDIEGRYCEFCKKTCDAKKAIHIENLPNLLILTLKRFFNDRKNRKKIKIYPKINIDGKNKYRLIATINHMGGINGGHYIANVSRNNSKNWFLANDSRISKQNLKNVIDDKNIYMALYEKIEN
jgi:ubiquitin C-terminal hydrolase